MPATGTLPSGPTTCQAKRSWSWWASMPLIRCRVWPGKCGRAASTISLRAACPRGLAPRIANLAEYSEHVLHRLHRQAIMSGDPELFVLEKELRGYPGVAPERAAPATTAELLFLPLVIRMTLEVRFSFFSTLATFGTAIDITL